MKNNNYAKSRYTVLSVAKNCRYYIISLLLLGFVYYNGFVYYCVNYGKILPKSAGKKW